MALAGGTVPLVGRAVPAAAANCPTSGDNVVITVSCDFPAGTYTFTGTLTINNGLSGSINAVAVNPALNLVAVCGQVSATSSLCQGTTPASCTPATAFQGGNSDLLVAVFNTSGVLQWARQVGSSTGLGDESCNAIAIDIDGTVFAAGKYQDELTLGTTALPSLNNSTAVRHMWVGHFDGKPNPALVGRTAAAPLFFEVVEALGSLGEAPSPPPGCTTRRRHAERS